jgi:hypothetical protein
MRVAHAGGARRLLLSALAATVAGATLVTAVPAGASGGAQDPPGWADPGNGAWVAFTVSPTTLTPEGRTEIYGPVTITRNLNGVSPDVAFPGWQTDTDGDGDLDVFEWPSSWSAGGVTLERTVPCDGFASTCEYRVIDAGQFWFVGGTPPFGADGLPDYEAFRQTLVKEPPKAIVATISWNKGAPGELGKLVLDGSGSEDPLGGTLSFSWVITHRETARTWSPNPSEILTQAIAEPGTYCINLQVTSSVDGVPQSAPEQCVTFTDAEVPAKPAPGGGGTVGAPSGGGGDIATVVFAKPSRRSSLGLGSGSSAPTVVWLWRPEWYTGSQTNERPARTTGQPKTTGTQEIVVNRDSSAGGASAAPWLAGMAAFGLIGAGFLVTRKRRLRLEP